MWDDDQLLIEETQHYCYLIDGKEILSENYKQYLLADLQDEYNRITKAISLLTNNNQNANFELAKRKSMANKTAKIQEISPIKDMQ